MLHATIEYINRNPLLFILIILILVLIVWNLFENKCTLNETMAASSEVAPTVVPATPATPAMPKVSVAESPVKQECCPCPATSVLDKYVNNNTLVNFHTKINNVDYFLTAMPNLNCDGFKKSWEECNNNVVALVPASVINNYLANYKTSLNDEMQKCNFNAKLQCSHKTSSAEADKLCNKEYPECKRMRHFICDFLISEVPATGSASTTPKTYKLLSFPLAMSNVNSPSYLVNQIGGATSNTALCADTLPTVNNFIASLNILEGSAGKFKLRFNRQIQVGKSLLYDTADNSPKLKFVYVGKCATQTCKYDNNQLTRVCLLDDPVDPNVLEFDIQVVS
jgi:hypothetical protein